MLETFVLGLGATNMGDRRFFWFLVLLGTNIMLETFILGFCATNMGDRRFFWFLVLLGNNI